MRHILNIISLVILSVILFSCGDQVTSSNSSPNDYETSKIITSTFNELSPEEAEGLLFMRQEEKVARDVYTVLGQTWNSNVFEKIKISEQNHMDAVKGLIVKYNLIDPVVNDEVGVFADPSFQQLFDNFVEQGQQSVEEAFIVGQTIEEEDIAALENQLSFVDNQDIIKVYTNLKAASEKHLQAFSNHITPSSTN